MDSDSTEMVNEIKSKVILHWNCRGLTDFPEAIRIYGSHIEEIYLKWNKLTTLPPWITELLNVTNLYMYGNFIKEIPPQLSQMNQLTVLDLSANKIEQIPPCMGSLVNLKSLLLNDNFIEKLPVEMSRLDNLEILCISGNQFITLPEWVGSLPRLKELSADNNHLKEVPNRLTLSPEILIISVCSNRLKYLPLNAFVSSPCIRFDANVDLNYLSYPVLLQITSQNQGLFTSNRSNLGYGCFKMHCANNVSHTNVTFNIQINVSHKENTDFTIELPRQLLKVYNIHQNTTVSLWELALRKVYTERYKHTLYISTLPVNVNISYEQIEKSQEVDFLSYTMNYASYNLLINGPASICVNSHCQQPIFTEAWIIIGISHHAESVTTVALCCSKRCASEFNIHSDMTVSLDWSCVNE